MSELEPPIKPDQEPPDLTKPAPGGEYESIIQVVNAAPWIAIFDAPDGSMKIQNVALWALLEHHSNHTHRVVGMVASDALRIAEDIPGFRSYSEGFKTPEPAPAPDPEREKGSHHAHG